MLAVLRELRQRLHHDGDHLDPESRCDTVVLM